MRPYAKSAAYYDLIYESIVDYEEECNLLEDLFRQCAARKVKRVLDLGCGTGNHAIILSSRGYDALGMDLSEDFIRLAQEKATLSEGGPRFVVGDMGKLDLKERSDAIISMFGAFGYIPRLEAPGVLKGFAEKLTEGGLLIFEFWNRLAIQPGHRSWLEREADELRLVRLSRPVFDPKSGVVHPIMKHYVIKGKRLEDVFEERHSLTTYLRRELRMHLRGAGFVTVGMLDWDNKVLGPASRTTFRVLAVARSSGPEM